MVLEKIENHIRERFIDFSFCVNCLAEELKLSESYLREMVNLHFKCSPQCLIETVRLENAVMLLCNDRLKIYSVCSEVGYANVKTFRTAFKKRTGMTPEECRNELRRSADVQSEINRITQGLWYFRNI
jgi:AraC-like DNA-binding protein